MNSKSIESIKAMPSMPNTTTNHTISDIQLVKLINEAATILAPVWPLDTIIACNPLLGFEDLPFGKALTEGAKYFQHIFSVNKLNNINRETIKWCLAFLDEEQATIKMPEKILGFYGSWQLLAKFDAKLHQKNKLKKQWLAALPHNSEQAIVYYLTILNINPIYWEKFFTLLLSTLPGWSSYIKYRQEHTKDCSITLVDFIAVRLAIVYVLWPEATKDLLRMINVPEISYYDFLLQLKKREILYRCSLTEKLKSKFALFKSNVKQMRPEAQLIFCIDVRSESFRRNLEAQENYETFGFAGFFGLPVRIHSFCKNEVINAYPVLLNASHNIMEEPINKDLRYIIRYQQGKQILIKLKAAYQVLKYNFGTSFALVETLGIWGGLLMFFQTVFPYLTNRIKTLLKNKIASPIATVPNLETEPKQSSSGIPLSKKIDYAESALYDGINKKFC